MCTQEKKVKNPIKNLEKKKKLIKTTKLKYPVMSYSLVAVSLRDTLIS